MFIFNDSDYELIAKIAQGNQQAFQNLYKRYKTHVFGLARRLLGQKSLAEDITQEVWMRVIDKSATFKPDGSVKTWILTITRNTCLNVLSKKSLIQDSDFVYCETETLENSFEFSESYWEGKKAEKVHQALDNLPVRQRTALILQYFEGLDLQTIARILELEPNAVKALLFRARKNLENEIKKEGETEDEKQIFAGILSRKDIKRA